VALLKTGILGAAISSVIAQCISACLILIRLYKDQGMIRLRFRKELFDLNLALRMLRYGRGSASELLTRCKYFQVEQKKGPGQGNKREAQIFSDFKLYKNMYYLIYLCIP